MFKLYQSTHTYIIWYCYDFKMRDLGTCLRRSYYVLKCRALFSVLKKKESILLYSNKGVTSHKELTESLTCTNLTEEQNFKFNCV